MPLKFCAVSLALVLACAGCASPPAVAPTPTEPLESWLQKQELRSWQLLHRNISPTEPKVPGGPKPLPGIVVAGLAKKDPDYYFHWVRDSADVMSTVVEMTASHRPEATNLRQEMNDFLTLNEKLQKAPLGEPRFTVEGEVDRLPWSRPQFDGPALRALALMRYLTWLEEHREVEGSLKRRVLAVVKRDVEFVAKVYLERGFDIWEEFRADNYNTRLAQLAALEKATHWFGANYQAQARATLEKLLNDHWDPARGFLRSQLAIAATDGYTAKKTDLDAAVLVTVVDVDRPGVAQTVMDPRVQATVTVLEDLFRREFPINQNGLAGLGYGRYQGDVYYGGNPWDLITACFAQFYYRVAVRSLQAGEFTVTKINRPFVRALPEFNSLPEQDVTLRGSELKKLYLALRAKGDAVLRRLQSVTPEDGDFFEQFDKRTGQPVSARSLSWAHSEFLRALLDRVKCYSASSS